MKREPESEARRWLLQAKHDLDDADFSFQKEDAQRALSICNEVIGLVEKKIGKVKNVTKNTERGT
jgi:HEPN domain-containing protein